MSAHNQLLSKKAFRLLVIPFLLAVFVIPFSGCEEALDNQPDSQITPNQFFASEADFVAAATAVYAQLRPYGGQSGDPLNLAEHTSDEIMVPTRGPDWGDGGIWRELTQHNWDPSHPAINGAWNTAQVGIARANGVLEALKGSESLPQEQVAQFEAEVRFLRAFYYYQLMDFFGNVPIVVEGGSELSYPTQPVDPNDPPPQNTRKEVFDFILQELTGCTSGDFSVSSCVDSPASGSILANLPAKGDVPFGRANEYAGYAFLARLLVNAEIYTGEATASGINPGTAMYEGAAAAADVVLNSGQYSLADDYFQNFAVDNHTSPEIIWAIGHKAGSDGGLGYQRQMAFLHYNQYNPATPWNGFTTIAEFYKAFEMEAGSDGEIGTADDVHTDVRGHQFLVGQQYQEPSAGCAGDECFSDPNSGVIRVRGSNPPPLNITLDIPSIRLQGSNADLEAPGARPLKFELDPSATDAAMGNDFPLFRLAEMYLIKAEAENEINGPAAAEQYLNAVRDRAGATPVTGTSSQTRMFELVLQERGFEFVDEGLRRQDLIRYEFAHGGVPTGAPYTSASDPYAPTFTGPWLFKEDGSEGYRALFPIPENQLSVNPNLQQNPGY